MLQDKLSGFILDYHCLDLSELLRNLVREVIVALEHLYKKNRNTLDVVSFENFTDLLFAEGVIVRGIS